MKHFVLFCQPEDKPSIDSSRLSDEGFLADWTSNCRFFCEYLLPSDIVVLSPGPGSDEERKCPALAGGECVARLVVLSDTVPGTLRPKVVLPAEATETEVLAALKSLSGATPQQPAAAPKVEQRRKPRTTTRENIVLVLADQDRTMFRGRLVEVSENGFRVRHEHGSLAPGQEVEALYRWMSLRARVVWNREIGQQVETGFCVLFK